MPWPGAVSHAEDIVSARPDRGKAGDKLRQADQMPDIGWRSSHGAEFPKAGRLRRLGEFSPLAIEHEAVVPVGRRRQAEQGLQQPMDAGRPEQVHAPHDLGHALKGIVDHDREVIAGRHLLAREDDVAPGLRAGGDRPDLAIGTTPVVQKAKAKATPALYFTNLISARPLFGVAGAGSLARAGSVEPAAAAAAKARAAAAASPVRSGRETLITPSLQVGPAESGRMGSCGKTVPYGATRSAATERKVG